MKYVGFCEESMSLCVGNKYDMLPTYEIDGDEYENGYAIYQDDQLMGICAEIAIITGDVKIRR